MIVVSLWLVHACGGVLLLTLDPCAVAGRVASEREKHAHNVLVYNQQHVASYAPARVCV